MILLVLQNLLYRAYITQPKVMRVLHEQLKKIFSEINLLSMTSLCKGKTVLSQLSFNARKKDTNVILGGRIMKT